MLAAASPIHDQATRLLRQRGVSATPARVRVLQLLLAADAALSHQALQQAAAASGQVFDKVTLYRVLDTLEAQGLVHSVAGHDRVRRFGPMRAHHAHAHFECASCGRLFCLPGTLATASPELPPGFAPERLDLTVHGRCADCAAGAAATPHRGER
jgi:Fur family ferric uptake transcriptional regulator